MTTGLKAITSMPQMSITKAHERIMQLDWKPTYFEEAPKYQTDYRFTGRAVRDSVKQVLRSYFPMQEEKDNRVYGGLDTALRGGMFRTANPRWIEWMKLLLSVTAFAESSAARAMALLAHAVPNQEIQNGLAFQMIDEVRHSGIQKALAKWYLENYIDPAGFDIQHRAFGKSDAANIGRLFGESLMTGDAVTAASVYTQIVTETAFTNMLFVALPSEAAANGDIALPTVFLSVQSDESRHISNGYSVLLMALENPDNYPLLERDLRYAFWQNHCLLDAIVGTIIEYGSSDRRKEKDSYIELWRRWVFDDYYRSYLVPLEKYGLKIHHDDIQRAWERMSSDFYVHRVAQFLANGWPLHFWRIDPLDEYDFEWFERKYPGWYRQFGPYWEHYRELSKPGSTPIAFANVGYTYPHRCWSCMLPVGIQKDLIVDEIDGEIYTFCSEQCHWIYTVAFASHYQGRPTPAMGRLRGIRDYETWYDGWDVADVLLEAGFVRPDGKTIIAQPHLRFEDGAMWTLDQLRGYQIGSPLQALRRMTPEQRQTHIAAYKAGLAFA